MSVKTAYFGNWKKNFLPQIVFVFFVFSMIFWVYMPIFIISEWIFHKKIIHSNIGTQKISEKSRKFQILKKIVIYSGMTRNFSLRSKTTLFTIKPLKIGKKKNFSVYFRKIDFYEIFGFFYRFLIEGSEKVQKWLFFICLHAINSISSTNSHANLFFWNFLIFEFLV